VAKALRTDRPSCCSWHHQAVDRVGDGLTVTARADDGIIEALEHESDAWIVAVQWHPEDTAATDPVQQRLFDAFVTEAAAACHRNH
jgi:putative glutamine amidotransferase